MSADVAENLSATLILKDEYEESLARQKETIRACLTPMVVLVYFLYKVRLSFTFVKMSCNVRTMLRALTIRAALDQAGLLVSPTEHRYLAQHFIASELVRYYFRRLFEQLGN